MPEVPKEFRKEQYMLRATFFLEQLESTGFFSLSESASKIVRERGPGLSWEDKEDYGIDGMAWDLLAKTGMNPSLVFCHPDILKSYPSMLRYYRSVALIPQKGLSTISGFSAVSAVEEGWRPISENKLMPVVVAINEVLCAMIKQVESLDEAKVKSMMFATAGIGIDGSWRNKIGSEGERVIRSLILRNLLENKEVVAFNIKSADTVPLGDVIAEEILSDINRIKSFSLVNGATVVFGSEPDVQFNAADGSVLGGVEIKAGLDPAGALERLGAMFKSFENMLGRYPNAETILVASCITDQVDKRLRSSRSVRQTYVLTEVLSNKDGVGQKFCNSIRGVLGLVDKRM